MQDYLINWNAGPLGVVLRPELGLDMPPVVVQLLPQQSVLRLSGVAVGDLLISVNGKKTTKLGYEKVVRLLFKEKLPIVLHFRVPNGGGGGGVGGGSLGRAEEASLPPPHHLSQQFQQRQTSTGALPLPSERERQHSAWSPVPARPPVSPASVLGVPADFGDPHAEVQHHHQQPAPLPPRNRRSQSVESATSRSRKASTSSGKSRTRAASHDDEYVDDDDDGGKREGRKVRRHRSHKDKAEAEERRLRKQYSVVWERGSLGLSFRAYNAKVNVPVVDFISAVRGQGRGMDRVCVNDVLIAVNGEKTKSLGVEKVLRWLHVVDKPVVLRFHSSSNRIPNNPVPQIANAPSLPPPQPELEPQPSRRPQRRRNGNNTADHSQRAENQPYQGADNQHHVDDHQPEPPMAMRLEDRLDMQDIATHTQRRFSTESGAGPRLPRRNADDSMESYIARAHENKLQHSRGPTSQGQLSDEVDAVGDFRREPNEESPLPSPRRAAAERVERLSNALPPPPLTEFDLQVETRASENRAGRRKESSRKGDRPNADYRVDLDTHARHAGARPMDHHDDMDYLVKLNTRGDPHIEPRGRMRDDYFVDLKDHPAARNAARPADREPQMEYLVDLGTHPVARNGDHPADRMVDLGSADAHRPDYQIDLDAHLLPHDAAPHENHHRGDEPHGFHLLDGPIGAERAPHAEDAHSHASARTRPSITRSTSSHSRRSDRPPLPPSPAPSPARPLTAKHLSSPSMSPSYELTLDEAAAIVARASGKPVAACEFAGVLLPLIQPESVQAKLLLVYARTCVAKEQAATAAVKVTAATSAQLPLVTGNPLGRHASQKYLNYTILHDEAANGENHTNTSVSYRYDPQLGENAPAGSDEPTNVPQPQPTQQPTQQPQQEQLTPQPTPQPLQQPQPAEENKPQRTPSDDFIALQDFVLHHDGSIAARQASSSADGGSSVNGLTNGSSAAERTSASERASDYRASDYRASDYRPSDVEAPAGEKTAATSSSAEQEKNEAKSEDVQPRLSDEVKVEEEAAPTADEESLVLSQSEPSDGHAGDLGATVDDLIALPPLEHEDHTGDDSDHLEPTETALSDPRVAALFLRVPDVHALLAGRAADRVLIKKRMIDEIQEILDSLQMEMQFERHSHMGMGTSALPPPPSARTAHVDDGSSPLRRCCRCGQTGGDLADLAVGEHGRRDWYCQDCWEFFFFSEEPDTDAAAVDGNGAEMANAKTRSRSLSGERGSELVLDDDDEAFKYSFHDSTFTQGDMADVWAARGDGDSLFARDSALTDATDASSLTDRADEVWL